MEELKQNIKRSLDSATIPDDSKTLADSGRPHGSPDALHAPHAQRPAPCIPDHELLTRIGHGSYGEVWLARNVMARIGP